MARRGKGLGFASVVAYDPYASEAKALALGVELVSFERALQLGDFFSLHMPLTPDTKVLPRAVLKCLSSLAPCLPGTLPASQREPHACDLAGHQVTLWPLDCRLLPKPALSCSQ